AARARGVAAFEAAPEAPAFMLYSSGTTGQPKGIVHAHRSFASLGLAFRRIGVGAEDRVLSTSKLFFAYGLEHGLLAPLSLGATAVLHPGWPDVDAIIELVERHRPAAFFSVPTVFRRLLAEPPERLAPFMAVAPRRPAAGAPFAPRAAAGRAVEEEARRRAAQSLRHVGDVLRLHDDAARHLGWSADRRAVRGCTGRSARLERPSGRRWRAGRALDPASCTGQRLRQPAARH